MGAVELFLQYLHNLLSCSHVNNDLYCNLISFNDVTMKIKGEGAAFLWLETQFKRPPQMCTHSTSHNYGYDRFYLYTQQAWSWELRGFTTPRVSHWGTQPEQHKDPVNGNKQEPPNAGVQNAFSKEDFPRSIAVPLKWEVLKDINVMLMGDFFAVTKDALPARDARILSFEPLE